VHSGPKSNIASGPKGAKNAIMRSFREWAGNVSNFPREITETALAHVVGDKAEQACRCPEALEKRR
jgi:hypothetical protein